MSFAQTCYIFDDVYSIGHLLWGLITRLAVHVMPLVTIVFFVGFVIYEVVEDRLLGTPGRAKCDIIEFVIGYIIGDILAIGLLG